MTGSLTNYEDEFKKQKEKKAGDTGLRIRRRTSTNKTRK